MERNQIKAGSFLSYVQMALNVLVNLIYTPLMIKLLGQSEYGLYNIVASTISMLSILNLGFGSGYIRYYAQYKAKNDEESIWKLNGLFIIIFSCIAGVAAICGLYISFHLNRVFSNGLTAEEYRIAKILMLLLTFNLTVSFPMSVFTNIISAHERFIILRIVGILKSVLSPILTIPLLLLGYGSIGIVCVTLFVALVSDFVYIWFTLKVLNQRFVFHDFEKGLFKSLLSYTVFIAINIVIDQINWNLDKVLLGRFVGTAAVAIYSVGSTLQVYYNMFSSSISGIFTPRIHAITSNPGISLQKKRDQLTSLFIRVGRIQFMVLMLICTGFILFGKAFIRLWIGTGYDESYYVAVLLIVPVTIPLIQHLGIEIQRAQNKHQFRSIAYLIMAIINMIMTIYLCQRYGAVGAAIGTAVSLILANGIVMNVYYQRKTGIDVIQFWLSIGRISLGLIPSLLIGLCIIHFADIRSWLSLIAWGMVYAICYAACLWFISMNSEEQDLLKKPINRMIRKL